MGYPGSADKRVAIERGELDGDCGSWTSMPEDWLRDNKITMLVRFSRTLAPGMPADLPYAGDLLTDAKKKQTLNLLTAGSVVGRPYIAPRDVPADRLAALRTAFDATMKDPAIPCRCGQAAPGGDAHDRRGGPRRSSRNSIRRPPTSSPPPKQFPVSSSRDGPEPAGNSALRAPVLCDFHLAEMA